jgi:hypothetical protein
MPKYVMLYSMASHGKSSHDLLDYMRRAGKDRFHGPSMHAVELSQPEE